MSARSAKRTLTGTGQYIQIKVPNTAVDYVLVVEIRGTYVGQVQAESRALDGAWDNDLLDEDSGVAVDGTYTDQLEANAVGFAAAFVAAGEDEIRVYLSAYTSGSVEVAVSLIGGQDAV